MGNIAGRTTRIVRQTVAESIPKSAPPSAEPNAGAEHTAVVAAAKTIVDSPLPTSERPRVNMPGQTRKFDLEEPSRVLDVLGDDDKLYQSSQFQERMRLAMTGMVQTDKLQPVPINSGLSTSRRIVANSGVNRMEQPPAGSLCEADIVELLSHRRHLGAAKLSADYRIDEGLTLSLLEFYLPLPAPAEGAKPIKFRDSGSIRDVRTMST